jgi:peptide/nickel transport system ATP-binding protein
MANQRNIGFVFQNYALFPHLSVFENVAYGLKVQGKTSVNIEQEVARVLELVGLSGYARQFPHQLSGGLRQRAMIAMALAAHPRLLVADEPTTALDVTVQKEILELLMKLRRDLGLALLFITHDLGVVGQVADRVAVLYAGRIVETGPTAELLRHPRHPYTEGLLNASPQLDSHGVAPIPGMVPALDALPPGCAFEPRCAYRQEPCSAKMPGLRAAGPDHFARCILIAE